MAPAVPDGRLESAYQDVLARHTQSAAIYDNFDTRLFVRATWLAPEFVEARLARESVFKAWPEGLKASKTAEALASHQGAIELFMGIHANDPKADDFGRGAGSIWRLALVVDGREVEPTLVERLGRSNSELRAYYSYLEPFWVGYRVRFATPAPTLGQTMVFKVASALGHAELAFKVEPHRAPH